MIKGTNTSTNHLSEPLKHESALTWFVDEGAKAFACTKFKIQIKPQLDQQQKADFLK